MPAQKMIDIQNSVKTLFWVIGNPVST